MSEDKIKYFDMFAGIGGFRTGLANAGDIFLPVGWCEIDRFAQKAYRTLYDTGGEYYRIAVELSMLLNIVAATNHFSKEEVRQLRESCEEEVKRLNGTLRLDDAVRWQSS